MKKNSTTGIVLLLFAGVAAANDSVTQQPAAHDENAGLEVVLVRGGQPGPGLWKVSSGENVMWILGEVSPFPRKIKWKATKFDKLLRQSQELLLDFSGYWRADKADIAAYKSAATLPEGTTLKDIVTPELHAQVQKTAKVFRAGQLDELRPFAATNRLVMSAMDSLKLDGFSARFDAEDLGQRRHIRITYYDAAEIAFTDRLKNWQSDSNAVCLERLLPAIEDGGAGLRRLGNAWSTGNINALRRLVPAYSFSRDGFRSGECADAMHGGEQQSRYYNSRRIEGWLQEAERALRENKSTMAVVLMSELFTPDGYLAHLRMKGYEIVEPGND